MTVFKISFVVLVAYNEPYAFSFHEEVDAYRRMVNEKFTRGRYAQMDEMAIAKNAMPKTAIGSVYLKPSAITKYRAPKSSLMLTIWFDTKTEVLKANAEF